MGRPAMAARMPQPTARRRPNCRAVKIHRNYTVEEAARVTGCAKGTIRRWVSSGDLPAITTERPYLILGVDLVEFLKARRQKRSKLRPHECFCLKCKAPRAPALGMAEFMPLTASTGNLRALCERCLTVMHKAISRAGLAALAGILEVTEQQGPKHLIDTPEPSSNEHLDQEPTADA